MNWYPEFIESQRGKDVAAMYPTPGLDAFCTLSGNSVTAITRIISGATERVFAVSGTDFVEISSTGTVTVRGAVASSATPASIAASQNQLVVISGGTAYSFDLSTNTFAAIVGMLGTPIQAGFTDGYFIVLLAESKQFQISALLDATSWDGLDTAIISVYADNTVSMIVDHREVWFIGKTASVAYYDSGNPDFPFDVIPSGYFEIGAIATWATAKMDQSVFFLGGGERGAAIAWQEKGYQLQRISNHAVEYAWSQYSTFTDAIGYTYEDQGHQFWVLYFPTGNATWVFDLATGMWHQRGFWKAAANRYDAHHSQCHTYAFGKHLVGDWASGKVYEMSINLYDDDGTVIRRQRRCPHISVEQKWVRHDYAQIDLEVGLGLVTPGVGFDPQLILRWSNDGGKTWSNDHQTSAGKLGEYQRRVIFRRLGRARDRVYEMIVSDPIPWRIVSGYLQATTGNGQ